VPQVRIPSVEDLVGLPPGEVERQLIRLSRRMTARDALCLQFRVEKAFCRLCFEGDLERVSYFLDGLPASLAPLSGQLLEKSFGIGIAWAAYGDQHHVIEYICQNLDDEALLGNDFHHALDVLTPVGEALSGPGPWAPDGAVAAVCKVASERNCPELMDVLEPFVDRALDRQISHQVQQ